MARRAIFWFLLPALLLPWVACNRDSHPAVTAPAADSPFALDLSSSEIQFDEPLLHQLRSSPVAYFRFLNRQWSQIVCREFSGEMAQMPSINLHGDAHIEQYAVTATEHGIDDFDDSAEGPAVIDLVRFASSIELTCRQLGLIEATEPVRIAFFEGYQDALRDSDVIPHAPAYVERVRSQGWKTQEEFLAWAEDLMLPLPPEITPNVYAGVERFRDEMFRQNPGLPKFFLEIKRIGRLRMGIGSSLTRKVLARVEGMTRDPLDDLIIEGKELQDLSSVSCIHLPEGTETLRVMTGSRRIGRLQHEILAQVPPDSATAPGARPWWVKSWEASYRELELTDHLTSEDLREIAYDVGVQLGHGHVRERDDPVNFPLRSRLLDSFRKLRPRIESLSGRMVAEMLEAWNEFRQLSDADEPQGRPN